MEEAGDQRPDLVRAIKQDQVPATPHDVQRGLRLGYEKAICATLPCS